MASLRVHCTLTAAGPSTAAETVGGRGAGGTGGGLHVTTLASYWHSIAQHVKLLHVFHAVGTSLYLRPWLVVTPTLLLKGPCPSALTKATLMLYAVPGQRPDREPCPQAMD